MQFVLVIVLGFYNVRAAVTVGPFYSPQSCLSAKAVALNRYGTRDAYCLKVDVKPEPESKK